MRQEVDQGQAGGGGGLSVVFLPPSTWPLLPPVEDEGPPEHANSVQHHLRRMGVRLVTENPTRWPWNPLYRKGPFLRGLDLLRAIRVMLRHRRADVVVSVFESCGFFLLMLRRLFFFKPKVVLWDASVGNEWRMVRFVQGYVFPRYDGFMMLTSSQVGHLRDNEKVRGEIAKVLHSVNEMLYLPDAAEPGEYVLAVGDDISRDYPTLFKAAEQIPGRVVMKTHWRPEGDAAAVPERVSFVSERLPGEKFRDLYAHAEVVVLPMHDVKHAGGITAVLEAMAMGKPLVVTDTTLAADFVINEVNALVVPVGDPDAMAAAVTRLQGDEALRRTLGENARRHIDKHLSARLVAQRMCRFMCSLSGKNAVAHGLAEGAP